ncbi:glutamate racemase [Helicobacter muridarum]|uniref:Glutamate racemase n=1 Tax=Helicobacter muridarum TaxID=216 RepID=A0A099U054_9HELI|nr:glutamate racemase [Helicobacter muridarum]TLE00143.1 glutamate racemase [Helicobacter muridarum]STQ87054.1 glutamate racemase [Helicobacter muridarum]
MQIIKKIGVFDSGVGGLTVLKSLIEEIGFEHIVYYGDTARVPYGNKDTQTIIKFSLEALEFFEKCDIDLLVVACNTASAHALKAMQAQSKIPVIGVIESGINALVQKKIPKDSNILVIATQATVTSGNYERCLIDMGYNNITSIATNLFVSLVEERIFNGNVVNTVFKYYFPAELKPQVIILGCTHFPLLIDALRNHFGKETIFVHSGEAIATFLQQKFNIKPNNANLVEFFASDNTKKLKATAKEWLQEGSYKIFNINQTFL